MHRGELAYLKKNYIRLPEYFLKSLNLKDKSRMSGLYYPNTYKDKLTENISETEDLIFSPIPFDIWPFTFRLSLKLDEKIGTIENISSTLQNLGMNILLCDCHKGGYRYNIWFIILNSTLIQEKYSKQTAIHLKSNDEKKIQQLKEKIEMEMDSLREKIEKKIFALCNTSLFLFENEKETELSGIERDKKTRSSFTIKTGKTLPYHFWKYHFQNLIPHSNQFPPFECIVNNNKIEFQKESLSDTFLEKIGLTSNSQTNAFINIHTTATRIRVSIIPNLQNNVFRKILINYSVENCSIGYLKNVSSFLKENNIKILNINNSTSDHTLLNETGVFELIVKAEETSLIELESRLKLALKETISYQSINVRKVYNYRIFVSIQSKFFFRKSVLDTLYEIGEEFGLNGGKDGNFIIVEENVENTEPAVIKSLQECDGFFQFLIDFKKEEDYTWLEAEYLSAKSLNKPIVRVTDANSKYESKIDTATKHFEISFTDNDMENSKATIREMLKKLLEKMKSNSNSFYST